MILEGYCTSNNCTNNCTNNQLTSYAHLLANNRMHWSLLGACRTQLCFISTSVSGAGLLHRLFPARASFSPLLTADCMDGLKSSDVATTGLKASGCPVCILSGTALWFQPLYLAQFAAKAVVYFLLYYITANTVYPPALPCPAGPSCSASSAHLNASEQ